MMTRRYLLKKAAAFGLLSVLCIPEGFTLPSNRLHIGACDWSLGKGSDPAAFEIAKEIGLEGIQVNLSSAGNNLRLRDKKLQQIYLEESARTKIKIASLAIGELNGVPYKSDPRTEEWVSDSIDVAKNFGVTVVLLAFFEKGDLRNDEAGKKEVVRRLKKVASKAEKMGITLGIESYLSAEELTDIIQQVGSKSIKVYYDFRNSADAGYDVIKEIKFLGKEAICELHIKENGLLLGEGTLDWKRIATTLNELGYYGDRWMQIEWANPKDGNVVQSYKKNVKFLNDTFGYS
jgi:L-ribulose-5-phosphate 3-epimerase